MQLKNPVKIFLAGSFFGLVFGLLGSVSSGYVFAGSASSTPIVKLPKADIDKTTVELIADKITLQDQKVVVDSLASKYAQLYDGCKNK